MPDPADFDTQEEWMSACVPQREAEGDTKEAAVGACLGMWNDRSSAQASGELIELATAQRRLAARRTEQAVKPKTKARGAAAELFLYEEIDELFGITAKSVVDEIKALGSTETLTVRINSIGGSTFEAVPIYNALIRHPSRVEIKIDGVALSAASLIAMAGDHIEIADNGLFMLHDPWTMAMGNASEMRSTADLLDRVAGTMHPIYARRSKLPHDEIVAMMAEETWLDANEALAKGFVDSIVEGVRVAASWRDDEVRKRFRHPERLMARAQPAPSEPANLVALDERRQRLAAMEQKARQVRARAKN